MNETHFKRFLMIIKSAGFITPKMIRSQNAINFAYIVYLKLRSKGIEDALIERFVRKWFVYSILTGRYSGSPESTFDFDIRQIEEKSFADYLAEKEAGELSDAFWEVSLTQRLNTSVSSSPFFHIYLASQVHGKDKGFLSREITVSDLITYRGDIHHIFPRSYLKKHGFSRGRYNQIANYVYMQSEVNIRIGKKAPEIYFNELRKQVENGELKYGGIETRKDLDQNLTQNCIPQKIFSMKLNDYDEFLEKRRSLMAQKIKTYYYSL